MTTTKLTEFFSAKAITTLVTDALPMPRPTRCCFAGSIDERLPMASPPRSRVQHHHADHVRLGAVLAGAPPAPVCLAQPGFRVGEPFTYQHNVCGLARPICALNKSTRHSPARGHPRWIPGGRAHSPEL
jgi:hypothetical protein